MHKLPKIMSLLFSAAFILMASTFAIAEPAEDFIAPTGAQIQKEVSDINASIKAQGGKWVAGETSMSVLSPAERRTRLGLAIPAPGETGPVQAAGALAVPESGPALPTLGTAPTGVLDWRNYTVGASALSINPGNYVTPVRNQASCGDCWVFGSVGALESRTLITQNSPGVKLDLSEEAVATCDSGDSSGNACAGGIPVTSFFYSDGSNGTGRHGIPVESCDPYIEQNSGNYMKGSCGYACSSYFDGFDSYGITGYQWVNNYWNGGYWSGPYWYGGGSVPTVAALKNALYQNGPVAISFEVFNDFYHYTHGIYSYDGWSADVGGHLVLLVGYDDNNQCFIVKNSWGPGWGEGGFFRIAYSQVGGNKPYYYNGDGNWHYYGPFFGGYAVSYTGAVSPYLGSSIYYPSPSSLLSKKIIGKAVCTITGLGQWDSQHYLKNVTVSTDGGNTWHPTKKTFTSSTWMTWSYNWPLPKDGTYTIMTMATDGYTNTQGGGITVAVDNTAPSSAITAPATGPLSGASYPVTGTAADNLSGVSKVEVSTDGGKTWNLATDTSGAGTWATWRYDWTLSDGAYTIKSRATDIAQNVEKPLALAAVAVTVPSVVTLTDVTPNGNSVTATASLANAAGQPVSGQAVSFYCAPQGTTKWALKSTVWTDGSGTCISHAFTLPAGSYQVRAVNKFTAKNTATSTIMPVTISAITSAQEPVLPAVGTEQATALPDASATATITPVISPTGYTFTPGPGIGSVTVTRPSGSLWTAVSKSPWIHITSVLSTVNSSDNKTGTGNGTVNYAVDQNNSTRGRIGTITIAAHTFTVTQTGVPAVSFLPPNPLPSACAGEVYNQAFPAPSSGAGGPYTFTSHGALPLGVFLDPINGILSGTVNPHSGNHTYNFRLTAIDMALNKTTVPTSITVYGFSVQPIGAHYSSAGGAGNFNVITDATCPWEAASTVDWITGINIAGDTISYAVSPNLTTTPLTGFINIINNGAVTRSFKVTQAAAPACAYTLSPAAATIEPGGGSGNAVSVVPSRAGCTWDPTATAPTTTSTWIHITGSAPAPGDGTDGSVTYSVDQYTGTAKHTGTMKIAGKTFTVTQSPPAPPSVHMYDGPYTGTFNYTYEDHNSNGTYTEVPGSFQLTVTLSYQRTWNPVELVCTVTQASCTDPAFGCVSGCIPIQDGGMTYVDLPLYPPYSTIYDDFRVALPNTVANGYGAHGALGVGGIGQTSGVVVTAGANGGWTLSNGPFNPNQYQSGWGTFSDTPYPYGLIPTITDPLFDGSVACTSWSLVKQ